MFWKRVLYKVTNILPRTMGYIEKWYLEIFACRNSRL